MIETDGSYHVYDALKTAFPGAGCTYLTLTDAAIGFVESLPFAQAFRDKASAACQGCLMCRLFPICGGGSPIHRFSEAKGFDQPSVYCADLMMLIEHVRDYLLMVRPKIALTY